ncbi:uncharacterized protein LOC122066288 [Macadamia integrifolia]|uniref:uncharacterized protein LOC122066288 n=1 Tax=Macadamia integrifolia TaxID=60698 RepID=UPI001C4FE92A|nr:uncharacterized protein LOC122066288 [Macadamia integrifolia]
MEYQFSHPHPLTPYQAQENEQIQCSGCKLPSGSGLLYGCSKCRYFLHEQCRNRMKHPSHPNHPLTLLSKSPYASGSFICNGCGFTGEAFVLNCGPCEFDLHIQCASLPLTILHKDHPKHPLTLYFEFPIDASKTFSCDVCHSLVDRDGWIYYCKECNYGTHVRCAKFDPGEAPQDKPLSRQPPSSPASVAASLGTEKQMETPVQTVGGGGGGLSRKDEEDQKPLKQVGEEMLDTELEISRLQIQLTRHIAQVMSWACR